MCGVSGWGAGRPLVAEGISRGVASPPPAWLPNQEAGAAVGGPESHGNVGTRLGPGALPWPHSGRPRGLHRSRPDPPEGHSRGGWEGTRVRGGGGLPGSPVVSPAPGHLRSPPQGLCTCCSHPFPRVWPAPPCHSGMGSRVTSPWWRLASSGLCPPRDCLDFPVVPLAACHVGTSPAWPAAPWAWSCPPRTRRRCAPEACPCWTVSQASRDAGSSVPAAARALEPQL